MGQIWQAALAIIDSIGGAGVIILGVVKFTFVVTVKSPGV